MSVPRKIDESWFRASSQHTTMSFLGAKAQERTAPLGDGERQLGWLVLPPFQRPPVWTRQQQVRFIESCWLGLPIGSFIYNRTERFNSPFDSWLLDGQQRVTAVLAYTSDEFPVFGYLFSELEDADYRRWSMSVVFPNLVTNIDDEEALRDVYDRLAYGGTPHEPKTAQGGVTRQGGDACGSGPKD